MGIAGGLEPAKPPRLFGCILATTLKHPLKSVKFGIVSSKVYPNTYNGKFKAKLSSFTFVGALLVHYYICSIDITTKGLTLLTRYALHGAMGS